MNVLSGIYRYGSYTGDIYFDGELCKFKGIEEKAERKGIVIIHQELALVPQLSVAENLFLGNERLSCRGVVDWGRTNMEAKKLLQTVGVAYRAAGSGADAGRRQATSSLKSPRRFPKTCGC